MHCRKETASILPLKGLTLEMHHPSPDLSLPFPALSWTKLPSLLSKRFRFVSEQRKTEEQDYAA